MVQLSLLKKAKELQEILFSPNYQCCDITSHTPSNHSTHVYQTQMINFSLICLLTFKVKLFLSLLSANLKKMFKKIVDAKTDEERMAYFEPLQEIMTYVQFANDECDYGEGLELGIDLFTNGAPIFHKAIKTLLSMAYQLLDRGVFAEILELHLNDRRKTDLSQIVL